MRASGGCWGGGEGGRAGGLLIKGVGVWADQDKSRPPCHSTLSSTSEPCAIASDFCHDQPFGSSVLCVHLVNEHGDLTLSTV